MSYRQMRIITAISPKTNVGDRTLPPIRIAKLSRSSGSATLESIWGATSKRFKRPREHGSKALAGVLERLDTRAG
jgi:hypothetical protein